jgi:uncharacterized protein (DUF2236 family)
LRRGVATRPEERAVYAVLLAAGVSILPPWARRELKLSAPSSLDLLLDTTTVIPLTRAVSATMRWLTSGSQTAPAAADR